MQICKWNVHVDDEVHMIGAGQVLYVDCQRGPETVQVWTEEGREPVQSRQAIVLGTGMRVPDGWNHIGSALAAEGALVWHVYAKDA